MNFGQIESHAAQAYRSFSGRSAEERHSNDLQYGTQGAGQAKNSSAMSAFAYFRQADANRDGMISPQEYSTGTGIDMAKLNDNVFGAFNFDGQSGVSIHEAGTSLLLMDAMDAAGSLPDGKITGAGRGEFETFLSDENGRADLTETLRVANERGDLEQHYQQFTQGLQQTEAAETGNETPDTAQTTEPAETAQPGETAAEEQPLSGDWNTARSQRRERAGVGSISDEIAKTMQASRQPAPETADTAENTDNEQTGETPQTEGALQPEGETADEAKPQTYNVRFGDTYWNIAEAIQKNNQLEASHEDVMNALREQVGDADTQLQVGREVNVDDIVNKFKPQTEEASGEAAEDQGSETEGTSEGASSALTQGFRQHLQNRLADDNELSQQEFNEAARSFVESQRAAGKTVHFDRTKLFEAFNATKGAYDNSGFDTQIEIQDLIADEGKADEALSRLGLHDGAGAPTAEALATEYLTRMQDLGKFNQFSGNSDSLYLYQFMNSVENFVNEKKAAGEDIHFDPSLESTLFHEMKGASDDSGIDLTVSYNDMRSGKARDIIARFFATH